MQTDEGSGQLKNFFLTCLKGLAAAESRAELLNL